MQIVDTRIEPTFVFRGHTVKCQVHATTEDGAERPLFSFYPDQKKYNVKSLIGMTLADAKDVFQSPERILVMS